MNLPTIRLNRETLTHFEDAIQREWVVTNGLGGYASSTVFGINTRKYHGLLVAAFRPPKDRRICLAKLDEEISIGNNNYPLGANEFQSGVFPKGYMFLKEFAVAPFPKYVYAVENVEVQKTIFMTNEKNAVITLYRVFNRNNIDVKARVFPLMSCRHFHSVVDRWKNPLEFVQKSEDKAMEIHFSIPKGALMTKATNGQYHERGKWIERLFYREDANRGESSFDDCYQPGYFEAVVKANEAEDFAVTAVAGENDEEVRAVLEEMPDTMYDADRLFEEEMERRSNFLDRFYESHKIPESEWLKWVLLATDAFIVKGVDGQKCVMAGYFWFEAWGRDTFISLPGLMLATGRFEDARRVFLNFKRYCQFGLIPNFVPDMGEVPSYNTVDASLWYVNGVLQYLKYTGDFKFVREQLWETLKTIVEKHEEGTEFGIGVDGDGLLLHGPRLTWMDAEVEGKAITPRAGKAVEIQALWYNALKVMQFLAGRFGEGNRAEKYALFADKARKSFVEKFWNAERNCLFDVVNAEGKDASLRPNQIVAVALDFAMLNVVRNERIVDVVHRELLTPYGLRTLAKNDSRYRGVYVGDRRMRDEAYHNGTVWAWLLGPFTTAFLKTKGYAEFRREYALKNFVAPLFTEQIGRAGLGVTSEIFDGDPPHTPRGCIAQAWSVAEPLRAYVGDIMQVRPRYESEVLKLRE